MILAMPKSRSFSVGPLGEGTSIMFAGLRSRWATPAAWTTASAESTGLRIARHSAGDLPPEPRRPRRSSSSVVPVSHSRAIQAARLADGMFETPKSKT
jgi:hypothetical protein